MKDRTISEMGQEMSRLEKTIRKLSRRNKKQRQINENQARKLDFYENPNVPSSKIHHDANGKNSSGEQPTKNSGKKGKTDNGKKGNGKKGKNNRGGVPGHDGDTQIFKPAKVVQHAADRCPKCGEKNICNLKRDK